MIKILNWGMNLNIKNEKDIIKVFYWNSNNLN